MASNEHEAVQVADFLHMKGGSHETSYATNSFFQEIAISKVKPILEETIKDITNIDDFPRCFNIADLGCSSGPNTLLAISNIVDYIHEVCKVKNVIVPQFQVCLNDLYGNDFNTLFKSLPTFYANYKKENGENGPCYISVVPGSFYGRLFPDHSMHFFHSSTSLHWLSQIPADIENNKLNIYISKASPPNVFEKYKMQFKKDFTTFLESRSTEIIHGGRMFLTLLGRSSVDPYTNDNVRVPELMAESLLAAVKKGLIQEHDLNSFNVPIYYACKEEIRDIIRDQGSFSIDILDTFKINWDPYDTDYTNVKVSNDPDHGKRAVKVLRAVGEPLIAAHFGNSAMDFIYENFEKNVTKHLSIEKTKSIYIVISLTKI